MSIQFIVIMGVSGSGKTTVGLGLARNLHWDYYDADDYHSEANIQKMSQGVPLNDSDRAPWLRSLNELIVSSLKAGKPGVLACSALKDEYRAILFENTDHVKLVYLKGTYDQIKARIQGRKNHYMKPELLGSQFEALEEPANALVVDTSDPVESIVDQIESVIRRD